MKQGFRQAMASLHTWSTLLPGWVLYFMFLTGTTGYFANEIDRWMRPELPMRSVIDASHIVAQGVQQLRLSAPDAARWTIDLQDRDDRRVRFYSNGVRNSDFLGDEEAASDDDVTIRPRDTGGGHALYKMHWQLHYLPQETAYWVVGVCALALLMALISGVVAHRRIFKDFFTFRPAKGARSWLDAHSVLGVMALPYYLMIAYTGLVLMMSAYWPVLMHEIERFDGNTINLFNRAFNQMDARGMESFLLKRAGTDAPLIDIAALVSRMPLQGGGRLLSVNVLNPGDANARVILTRMPHTPVSRLEDLVFNGVSGELLYSGAAPSQAAQVNQVLTGLHQAIYAGPSLRWLYFFSGLMGAAMIATGLVLWTAKRRRKQVEQRGEQYGKWALALVERLNVGVIAGLPVAIAAYFWANRLLPTDFAGRAAWELHTIFLVWVLLLLYAASRPLMRSWLELLSLAALAYGMLPLLNVLTTDRHLGVTLAYDHWRGDWRLAGFDLTVLSLGMIFAAMAGRVRRHVENRQPQPTTVAEFSPLHIEMVE